MVAADSNGAAPPRHRVLRTAGVALFLATGLAGALVAGALVARTAIVEAVIRGQLESLGVTDVALSVVAVGPAGLRIESLRLGAAVTVAAIDVAYTPAGLAERRLETIVVSAADVDVSRPDAVLALVRRALQGDNGAALSAVPAIRVVGARVHAETPAGAFSLRLDGRLDPDLAASFVARLEAARAMVAGGEVGLSGLGTEIKLEAGAASASLRLVGGRLADAATPPRFAPLAVDGAAVFDGHQVRFDMAATGLGGRLRLAASGEYDPAADRGSAALRLDPLRFAAGDLQPADLAPAADVLGRVLGTVSARARATWGGGRAGGEADVRLSELAFAIGDIVVEDLSAALHLALADLGDELEVRLDGGRARVALGGREVRLDDVEATLSLGAAGTELRLLRARLSDAAEAPWFTPLAVRGTARLGASTVTARLQATTALGVRLTAQGRHDLAAGRGTAAVSLAPVALAPGGVQPRHLLPAAALPGAVSGTVSGRGHVAWGVGPIVAAGQAELAGVSWTGGDLTLRDLTARLKARYRKASGLSLAIDPADLVVEVAGQAFGLGDVRGRAALGATPVFDLVRATLRHDAARPWFVPLTLGGEARLRGDSLRFHLTASAPVGGVVAAIDGGHGLDTGGGAATLRLGPLTFAAGGPQPGDLAPPLAVLERVAGTVGGEMELRWDEGGVRGKARLALDDLSFATATVAVDGLSGQIGLDSLAPPAARSAQTLRARRIVGALSLGSPMVRFRFRSTGPGTGRFHLERGEAEIAGGLLSVTDAVFDSGVDVQRLTLRLRRVDLGRLMALFGLEGVAGSGLLSGAVPLEIGAGTVRVAGGLLEAEGPGVLRFRSAAARRVLAAGGAQAALLLEALEDFRYERLSLTLDQTEGGGARIRLATAGHNPAVQDGQPFVLNISLTGNLDRVLAVILEGYRLSEGALRATIGAGRRVRPEEGSGQ